MAKGLWYFAHPYTARDVSGRSVFEAEEANFNLCNWRAGQLLQRGYAIYSPISHSHPIHAASPEFLARQEHAMWYALDNIIIKACGFTGIILAPGWERSDGCKAERERFEKAGKPVVLWETIMQHKPTEQFEKADD